MALIAFDLSMLTASCKNIGATDDKMHKSLEKRDVSR